MDEKSHQSDERMSGGFKDLKDGQTEEIRPLYSASSSRGCRLYAAALSVKVHVVLADVEVFIKSGLDIFQASRK